MLYDQCASALSLNFFCFYTINDFCLVVYLFLCMFQYSFYNFKQPYVCCHPNFLASIFKMGYVYKQYLANNSFKLLSTLLRNKWSVLYWIKLYNKYGNNLHYRPILRIILYFKSHLSNIKS